MRKTLYRFQFFLAESFRDPFFKNPDGAGSFIDPFVDSHSSKNFEDPFSNSGNSSGVKEYFGDLSRDGFTSSNNNEWSKNGDPFANSHNNSWNNEFSNRDSISTSGFGESNVTNGSIKSETSVTSFNGSATIESKRQESIHELINTEEIYMTDMQTVKEVCSESEGCIMKTN